MATPMIGSRRLRAQGGYALIAILSIVVLLAMYVLVTQLNASNLVADRREHNAKVLQQAKQALIGYVAQQAAQAGEPRPGALPCPEAAAYYGDPTQEGIAASSCTLPKVGRFPWRTLGVDKLVDAAGEPLWYAVSPGWAYTSPATTLTINSNTSGQLAVDGAANDSIALIIAPGPAFSPTAAPGCAAFSQVRPASGTLDVRNYLECENATSPTDVNFVTTGPSSSFNDQVLRVTTADLLPALEAAIAVRIQREVVPALKGVYASSQWGFTAANPLYPFPAPFSDPTTSTYQGATSTYQAGTYQGLLPFNYSQSCVAGDVRCSATFVAWNTFFTPVIVQTGGAPGALGPPTCTFSSSTTATCTGSYAADGAVPVQMNTRASNVAMALRAFDPTQASAQTQGTPVTSSTSGAINSDGSATVAVTATLPAFPGTIRNYSVTVNIAVLADHPLLNPSDATTGWFVRNEWYRLLYYAVARDNTATYITDSLPGPSCTTAVDCLTVTNIASANKQRAILILAGRRLPTQTRPSGNVADFLEFGNADLDATFEQQRISMVRNAPKAPFNDRIVSLDANP
jgi:hypothetical protein